MKGVLLGFLLLAAASQKSLSGPAIFFPVSQFQDLTSIQDGDSEAEELNVNAALSEEVQNFQKGESEEELNIILLAEIHESLDVATSGETPMSTDIIAVNNNSHEQVAGAAGGGYSFSFHAEALPWLDAVSACGRRGGRLATPHSPHEARVLGDLLRAEAPGVAVMHVGVSDFPRGYWTTLQGKTPSAAGYDVWLGNHSRVDGRPSCAALLPNGLYIRSSCGAARPFACEMPTVAEGYVQLPGLGLYRIHATPPLPWLDALHVCRREGATLAVPSTALEAGFLAGAFIFNSQHVNISEHGMFVGIADYANEGDWQTAAGESRDKYYNSWSSEENRDGLGGKCAVLKPTGRYGEHPCEEPLAFCCKRTRFLGNAATAGGYRTIPGVGTYRLHRQRATWFNAFLQCLEENATLALPHSPQAAQELTDWIKDELVGIDADPYFHVAYHDIDGDGTFQAISERPVINYNNWWTGYPKRNGDRCVSMGSRLFFNYPCDRLQEYFCEKHN